MKKKTKKKSKAVRTPKLAKASVIKRVWEKLWGLNADIAALLAERKYLLRELDKRKAEERELLDERQRYRNALVAMGVKP